MTPAAYQGYTVLNLVVNNSLRLDRIFSALSDPTRRSIIARLARGHASVTDLASPFDMSLPAVSKHLRVLENAGLVKRRVRGRVHQLRLVGAPLEDAARWITHHRQFWEHQLDSLSAYLETESAKREPRAK